MQAEGFTTPMRSSSVQRVASPSALGFIPKDLMTTESISDVKMNAATLMPDSLAKKEDKSTWEKFANWITSTENRLYIGWFGTLMFPTLLAATACFITAFIAAPPGTYFLLIEYPHCVKFGRLTDGFCLPQSTSTESVNLLLDLCSTVTTSSRELLSPVPTPLECTFTPCGKLLRSTNGCITEVLTS